MGCWAVFALSRPRWLWLLDGMGHRIGSELISIRDVMMSDRFLSSSPLSSSLSYLSTCRYLGLFALQLLPSLLIGQKFASFLYFGLLAVSTVYLGAKRQDIPDVSSR